jgi:hypothetical protein
MLVPAGAYVGIAQWHNNIRVQAGVPFILTFTPFKDRALIVSGLFEPLSLLK